MSQKDDSARVATGAKRVAGALGLALAAASIAGVTAPAALAQTAPSVESANSDEIVVTAQRREERLQDVPISITALGTEALSDAHITNINELRGTVPGLSVSSGAQFGGSGVFSMRGVSGQLVALGASGGTAFYLDGVYLPGTLASVFSLDDVERVEVLRGPQGTLYGRNSTGGAINVITREPSDTLTGGIDASYGDYNNTRVAGSISGPLGGGFSGGFAGTVENRDSFYTNVVTGVEGQEHEDHNARASLRWENEAGTFDARLSAYYAEATGADYFKRFALGALNYGTAGGGLFTNAVDTYESEIPRSAELREIVNQGGGLVMNYELSPQWTLTSITGFHKLNGDFVFDNDATAVAFAIALSQNETESFSQEFRGVFTGERLRAAVGANLYHEDGSFASSINILPLANLASTSFHEPYSTSTLDAYAAFAQIEYDATDRLTLIVGGRYNYETRDYTIDLTGAIPAPPPGSSVAGNDSEGKFLPSIGVNYDVSEDVLLYAKVSEGYLSPGFNYYAGNPPPAVFTAESVLFDAEDLWAYEVGLKSQYFDRQVTLNLAAFYSDYSDIQVRTVFGAGQAVTNNAEAATIMGVDAEVSWNVTDALTISANATYQEATFDKFCEPTGITTGSCPVGSSDRSGNDLPFAPSWVTGVRADYSAPITSALTLNTNLSYSYQSGEHFTTANLPLVANDGWTRIDARVGLQLESGPEFYIYGRNLADERFIGVSAAIGGNSTGALNDPRTYGAGVRYHF